MPGIDRKKVRKDFAKAVNMSAAELRAWLATKDSRSVGWTGKDGKGSGEASVMRAAGASSLSLPRKIRI